MREALSDWPPEKAYLRLDEVAALLDVHANTIRHWINKGKLEHVRVPGGSIRIPRAAIVELLKTRGG
jgi:excisionase family DNA binding protein